MPISLFHLPILVLPGGTTEVSLLPTDSHNVLTCGYTKRIFICKQKSLILK